MLSCSGKSPGLQTVACLSVLLGLAVAHPAGQQPVALSALLQRSGDYAAEFVSRFSNVIAEEHYVQTVASPLLSVDGPDDDSLKAEFLLVRTARDQRWASFHDVFELNGRAIQQPAGRLTTLLNPASDEQIMRAYNLVMRGPRDQRQLRPIANPVVPIAFLQPQVQPRFRFSLGKLDDVGGIPAMIVEFGTRRPTRVALLSDALGLSVRGRLWIEPDTGRVLKAQWSDGSTTVATFFKFDPAFGLAVPVEMREEYFFGPTVQPGSSMGTVSSLVGTATYGPFRTFGT